MTEFRVTYRDNGSLIHSTESAARLPVAGDFVGLPCGLIVRCQWRYMPTTPDLPIIFCTKIADEHAELWRQALEMEKRNAT